MRALGKGRYRARVAETAEDVEAAQALRWRAFIDGSGAAAREDGLDVDAYDEVCRHVLIEDAKAGALVAAFRLLPLHSGREIARSYSAQYYELSALESFEAPMIEMGRFCIEPGVTDPDILRVAWGALARFVEEEGVEMLFGCSSFHGTDAQSYADAFAMLRDRHIAPKRWLPRVKAPNVFNFARRLRRKPDKAQALRTMPPLLRSYLTMGGWVSDHAVVDTDMNTLHVFTGLEIGRIPPRRRAALLGIGV